METSTAMSPHSTLTTTKMVEPTKSMESSTFSSSFRRTKNNNSNNNNASSGGKASDKLYHLLDTLDISILIGASPNNSSMTKHVTLPNARYQHPKTGETPLHALIRRPLYPNDGILVLANQLIQLYPEAVSICDAQGNIPLHYAIAPPLEDGDENDIIENRGNPDDWKTRACIVQLLLEANPERSTHYLQQTNVRFDDTSSGSNSSSGSGCSPLYRAVQCLPDDATSPPQLPPTLQLIQTILPYCPNPNMANHDAEDKPLALLYRRFTRQFDQAEKFFAGDNSRPQVVQHRKFYKTAAANTWKIMETILLQNRNPTATIVHAAVTTETPPDLLRYIVETNAAELVKPDPNDDQNLPLHVAAKNVISESFPSFYSKYVIDELLYKFPEAATHKNAQEKFPFTLAVEGGKQWIGGGIKSLYDAYPDVIQEQQQQLDLNAYPKLKKAMAMEFNDDDPDIDDATSTEEGGKSDSNKLQDTEPYDAIMLVQQPNVTVSQVVTSMWAHEEDAGVQMLGCVALSKMLANASTQEILRIALSAVAAVVNAMKAHPNEVIVQEKACHTLQAMAAADGRREISFVASGAVAAIVAAMQAHVSDPNVQEEACGAIGRIIHYGGCDRATIVGSVSGCTAIVNAIAAHPDQKQVQRNGLLALRELTDYGQQANLPDLPKSQIEPLLEHADTQFPRECGEVVALLRTRLVDDE
jgi:hypothetical protein